MSYLGYDKINLGSGTNCLDGFWNVDWPPGHLDGLTPRRISENIVYRTPDSYMDVTDLSCIPDSSFSYVRASHILEHICISQVRTVLKNWVRILDVGGTIDIVVPDFDYLVHKYYEDSYAAIEFWEEYKNEPSLWCETIEKQPLDSKEMVLMEFIFLNGYHKSAFNFLFLKKLLTSNGIVDISRYKDEESKKMKYDHLLRIRGIKK